MSEEKKDNTVETEEVVETEETQEETAKAPENEIEIEELDEDEEVEESEEDEEEVEEAEELSDVEKLELEVQQQKDKYIRLMAEFDNFKKRTALEYGKRMETANQKLMSDIIGVRENFERAMNPDKDHQEFEAFFEGMKLIFDSLNTQLEAHGLEAFGEPGDAFDPAIHDAMMKQPSEDIDKDCIHTVFEKGYKLNGNIIKHAKVIVSDGPAA